VQSHALRAARTPAPLPAPAVVATPLRDEKEALVRLGGDRDLLDELIRMFLDGIDEQINELRHADTACDMAQLTSLAHAQKGTLGAIGATAARTLAAGLEDAARADDAPQAASLLAELLAALHALQGELRAVAA
jgi:two-component system, sensor histidine kinase